MELVDKLKELIRENKVIEYIGDFRSYEYTDIWKETYKKWEEENDKNKYRNNIK